MNTFVKLWNQYPLPNAEKFDNAKGHTHVWAHKAEQEGEELFSRPVRFDLQWIQNYSYSMYSTDGLQVVWNKPLGDV